MIPQKVSSSRVWTSRQQPQLLSPGATISGENGSPPLFGWQWNPYSTHRTSIIIHQLANLDKRWQEHVWGTRVFSHMLPWDWNLDPGQSPKHMQGTWISSFVCTTCMSEPGSLLRASKGTALQRLLAFPLRPTRVTVAFGTNWLDDEGGANGLCSPDNSTINPHFALSISIHASTANRCFRGVRVATSTGAYSAISSPVLEMRKILGSAKGYTVIEAACCWEIHVRADARAFLVARCFSEHVEQLCSAQTLGESVVNQLGREIPRPETWQTK